MTLVPATTSHTTRATSDHHEGTAVLTEQTENTAIAQTDTASTAKADTTAPQRHGTKAGLGAMDFDSATAALMPHENAALRNAPPPAPAPKPKRSVQALHDEAMRAQGMEPQPAHLAGYADLLVFLAADRSRPVALATLDADAVQRALADDGDAIAAYVEASGNVHMTGNPGLADVIAIGEAWRGLGGVVGERGHAFLDEQLLLRLARSPDLRERFVRYVGTFRPDLSGEEMDGYSIVRMLEGGTDPAAVRANVPTVHNIHRFEKRALDGLQKNLADVGRTRPLVLIVHTATDHNGAFHRDPKITELICNSNNLTLLIEVDGGLGGAAAHIRSYAASHGVNGRVQSVVLAGHGSPTTIEFGDDASLDLEPEPVDDGADGVEENNEQAREDEREPEVDQDQRAEVERRNAERQAFLDAMRETMADDGQIVLNACLTNAADTNRLPARREPVPGEVERPRNMAGMLSRDVLRDPDGGRVMAPQASIGRVDLVKRNGSLHLKPLFDKRAGLDDRIAYIEGGMEPGGFMAAVMDAADQDVARARTAVAARARKRGHGPSGIFGAMARACLPALAGERADLDRLRQVEALVSAVRYPELPEPGAEPSVTALIAAVDAVLGRDLLDAAAECATTPLEKLQYAVLQYLIGRQPRDLQRVLDIAGNGQLSCMALYILNIDAILLQADAVIPARTAGGRRLLLLAAMRENPPEAVRNAIREHLMSADRTTLNAAALADIAGFASPHEVLTAIGVRERPPAPEPAPRAPDE